MIHCKNFFQKFYPFLFLFRHGRKILLYILQKSKCSENNRLNSDFIWRMVFNFEPARNLILLLNMCCFWPCALLLTPISSCMPISGINQCLRSFTARHASLYCLLIFPIQIHWRQSHSEWWGCKKRNLWRNVGAITVKPRLEVLMIVLVLKKSCSWKVAVQVDFPPY